MVQMPVSVALRRVWSRIGLTFVSHPGARRSARISGAGLIGLLLLAIVTLRAGILPSLGSWILILLVPVAVVAVPVVLFVAPGLQQIGQISLGVLTGAGLVAWGYALWRDMADTAGGTTQHPW
jgi:hypothetical protein